MKYLLAFPSLLASVALLACTSDEGNATPTATATASMTAEAASPTAAPTRTSAPTSTPDPTSTSQPEDSAVVEWTLGEPAALPDGVTLVLGTGCWQCGGQYSTYETFDEGGRRVLYEGPDEVHVAGYLDDPAHLYIATCRPNCNGYEGQHEGTTTTLYESSSRGKSWTSLGEIAPVRQILGAAPADGLLVEFTDRALTRFPSGEPVEAPDGAVEESGPLMLDGSPIWNTAEATLIDGDGSVVVDFSGLGHPGADVFHLDAHSDGKLLVWWAEDDVRGIAVLEDGDVLIASEGERLQHAEGVWLDDQRFIVSIQYRPEELAEFGVAEDRHLSGSRTPTIVDATTGTLHPIEDFFAPDAPFGRNYIIDVWQE